MARILGCSILRERSGLIDRTVESVGLPAFLRRTRYRVTVLPDEGLSEDDRRESEMQRAFRSSLKNVQASEDGGPYSCPCCGHRRLPSRGNYDLCPECDWEDDGQDDHDSDVIRGGPNGRLSLDAARAEYRATGAIPSRTFGLVRPTSSLDLPLLAKWQHYRRRRFDRAWPICGGRSWTHLVTRSLLYFSAVFRSNVAIAGQPPAWPRQGHARWDARHRCVI